MPMKQFILFVTIIFGFANTCPAQQVIRQKECYDSLISKQADSLKTLYTKDGFTLLREASVTMESEYEMPVVVPLTAGGWYQFVFIGDISSRLYEVRVYDWTEKQVVFQQKRWGDVDGNIIAFSYTALASQPHMFKPVQVNKKKKKNLCGYIMILRKSN